jgi:sugar lactone lactonase YvrE
MIASVFAPGFRGSNPQTISLYNGYDGKSNLYFMGRSNVDCYIVAASNTSYPSTTYTFSNLLDNTYTESNYTNGISGTIDGPIATARFNQPNDMAVNPINGNIYVADQSNFTIRMITPAGIVSTIAGTAGTNAQLDGNGLAARFTALNKLAINSTGTTLYAVQTSGQFNSFTSYIRTINLTSGNYEVASSSSFADAIYGMCIDPTNTYLYCTIYQALSVRRITIGSWASTTILNGDNYMGGICIDSTGSNLYFSDSANHKIKRIAIATSTVTTIVGTGTGAWNGDGNGTAVSINYPTSITINTSNTALYISDVNNVSIRMIELVSGNFTVTTIQGNYAQPYGTYTYGGHNGLFWHPYQNILYWASIYYNGIKSINYSVKPNSNVQIKNATGVPIRIAGTAHTVIRNSNIYPSLSATDVALLQNTNGNVYTIY